jgi:hypothetical protein
VTVTGNSIDRDDPYRSTAPRGRAGFGALVRSEGTKFGTVRGWPVGLLVAALVTVLIGVVSAMGSRSVCTGPNGGPCAAHIPPLGPDGSAVTDSFTFVHQELSGDGSLTVRVASLSGQDTPAEPWAKAGIIVKENTDQGSPYVAILLTGGHGIRLQHNYTGDVAGPGAAPDMPRWLRLTRAGATVTGLVSKDGSHWDQVGTATLTGATGALPIGLFVTSPDHVETVQRFGGTESNGNATLATAAFDHVAGQGLGGGWQVEQIGAGGPGGPAPGFTRSDGTFTLSGSGDIAPAIAGPRPNTGERSLIGVFAGLIVLMVIGTLFITSEYRRGLIRTTIAATPGRVSVLLAKAVVLGGVTFGTGLLASAVSYWVVGAIARGNGKYLLPVSGLTELRVIVGTAGLLAVSSVLALAVGTVLRRAAGAVATTTVLVVLPYILSIASVLPAGAANWLLRLTPAAGFAVQQSTPAYPQVDSAYLPSAGYFPLAPWAGFAVLCGWALLAVALAAVTLRRRDVSG